MLAKLHSRKGLQLFLGLLIGICFGFLLQKGGVTQYDIIIGQLLWKDFTVVKIMLTAMATGMAGVYFLRQLGWARLHPKQGSIGSSVIGGLIFGIGFGVLGYCPGTAAAASAQGALDALCGGVCGMLLGAGIFAAMYPFLEKTILTKGDFGDVTLPELFKINPWILIAPVVAAVAGLLIWMEESGL